MNLFTKIRRLHIGKSFAVKVCTLVICVSIATMALIVGKPIMSVNEPTETNAVHAIENDCENISLLNEIIDDVRIVGSTLVDTVETTTHPNNIIVEQEETTSETTTIETTTVVTTICETTTTTLDIEAVVSMVEKPRLFTKSEPIVEEVVETTPVREYVVYKPSTHYVHRNTCRWYDNTCYEITSTEGLETRKCSECNPDIEIVTEYVEQVPVVETPVETVSIGDYTMSYVKYFSRGTYYPVAGTIYGGSGRLLIDCSWGDGTVKGSIASSYLYNTYGYNYNGKRTMLYLEIPGYESMNGYYYLDDCDAGNPNVIDFYYQYSSNCIFCRAGVVGVDCYIVNY